MAKQRLSLRQRQRLRAVTGADALIFARQTQPDDWANRVAGLDPLAYHRQGIRTPGGYCHRILLEQLLTRKVESISQQLRLEVTDLALALQAEKEFRTAFLTHVPAVITASLGRQLQRQLASDGIIRLNHIGLLDAHLQPLGRPSEPLVKIEPDLACNTLVERASTRSRSERSKILFTFCAANGRAYFALLAPIGGLQPVGYLQLETDPITALAPLETELGMPIRIVAPSGQPAFQSRNWPGGISGEHTIYATHVQYTAGYEHGIDNYFRL